MDANLKVTHKIVMTKPKRSIFLEGKFNGSNFCFTWLDVKGKSIICDLYSESGKKSGSYKTPIKANIMKMMIQQTELESGFYSGTLTTVGSDGFAIIYPLKEKGIKAKVDMFNNKGKKKWSYTTNKGKKSYDNVSFINSSSDYVVISVISKPGMMSVKNSGNGIILDAKKGKKTGSIKADKSSSMLIFNGASYDESTKNIQFYGEKIGRKPKGTLDMNKKKGLFVKTYDGKGKIQDNKFVTWSSILAKVKGEDKKRLKDGAQVMIHEFIKTKDGRYIAIGEQYKKQVSALGVASTILNRGGGASVAKIVLYNMMVFDFDKDLKIQKVKVIKKDKSNVLLPSGYGWMSEARLGFVLKMFGQFDYNFTTVNSSKTNFASTYTSYNKGRENKKSRYTIGAVYLDEDNNVANVKFKLKTKPTSFVTLPSSPGYITIFEYFRKGKKIVIRKEKLDM